MAAIRFLQIWKVRNPLYQRQQTNILLLLQLPRLIIFFYRTTGNTKTNERNWQQALTPHIPTKKKSTAIQSVVFPATPVVREQSFLFPCWFCCRMPRIVQVARREWEERGHIFDATCIHLQEERHIVEENDFCICLIAMVTIIDYVECGVLSRVCVCVRRSCTSDSSCHCFVYMCTAINMTLSALELAKTPLVHGNATITGDWSLWQTKYRSRKRSIYHWAHEIGCTQTWWNLMVTRNGDEIHHGPIHGQHAPTTTTTNHALSKSTKVNWFGCIY